MIADAIGRAHKFYERLGFAQHGLSFVVDTGAER